MHALHGPRRGWNLPILRRIRSNRSLGQESSSLEFTSAYQWLHNCGRAESVLSIVRLGKSTHHIWHAIEHDERRPAVSSGEEVQKGHHADETDVGDEYA